MSGIEKVNPNGQISLGKEYAGQTVLVDEIEPGVWLVKTGTFIPDNERWLHTPESKAKLDEAIAWAETTPLADNFAEIEATVHND